VPERFWRRLARPAVVAAAEPRQDYDRGQRGR
jgi:hypothetical protein